MLHIYPFLSGNGHKGKDHYGKSGGKGGYKTQNRSHGGKQDGKGKKRSGDSDAPMVAAKGARNVYNICVYDICAHALLVFQAKTG